MPGHAMTEIVITRWLVGPVAYLGL